MRIKINGISVRSELTLRLLHVVFAELGPGLRDAAAHILLLDAIVMLDINGVVVHLSTVSVDLQRHVLVLQVAVELVLHAVVGLDLLVDAGQHLLHPLLVSLDVLHLPLQAVLHLVLDKVDANSRLSVLDTFIVDPNV